MKAYVVPNCKADFQDSKREAIQLKATTTVPDNRLTAVKQRVIQQAVMARQGGGMPKMIQRVAGSRNQFNGYVGSNSLVQRKVVDGSNSYSGSEIYKRHKATFDEAGVSKSELVEFVDGYPDITLKDLFQRFKIKPVVEMDADPCDEEKKASKEIVRTSATAKKHRKVYKTPKLTCQEPVCYHTSRVIKLNSDGTEKGYANKHGRLQAPPVAHHKDSPANIRLAALNDVARELTKKYGKSFDAIKLNSRFRFIRKKVEWTSSLGKHHQSHTTCNLRNKDITWKSLAETRKNMMRKKVRAYLKRKRFSRELKDL
ncbi:hypothetical protein CLV58_103121 [Spirosoma oryzae]|uniref:Uncharacterized protein n=1 Tax=Spirosoma oryzae TaxID=1469603 RepID=A0A2T0TEQ3_9BACT|nr:hypothetical protein [Spirosoma oryzae]PRY44152.1 hypothetical protein CLV58_103121 [Spirosoma oryzae]